MSPDFCYRLDFPDVQKGPKPGAVQPLTDYALASRLSYFLWASLPDAELLDHAAAGNLHRSEVLLAQTRRLLRDARVSPESRVRILEGNLVPGLVQHAWVDAPISIENQAGVTSSIRLESEQFVDDGLGESRIRWLRVEMVPDTPLTGASWEHRKLRIWSRDQGVRAAAISVNVGQGTQDLRFRGELALTFLVRPKNK